MNEFGNGKSENLKILFEALGKNKNITSLDLSVNEFSNENLKILGEFLSKNCTISSLNLGSNGLGSDNPRIFKVVLGRFK